jgi:septal ring factor EnvC (AmiA/AmiB activator)
MKNVNPLTVLFASIALVLIAFYSLQNAQNNLASSKEDFKNYMQIASTFKNQHSSYSNKTKITQKLQKIIKSSGISNANIINQNKMIKVELKSLSIKQIEKFTNKIFNEKFHIQKLQVTKNSIVLEIGVV